jgi:spermidine synthase
MMPLNRLLPEIDLNQKKNCIIPVILLVFFISGACGLVYEVVWLKMLSLVFGVTAIATSTTLASFMAGMALGSFWFGRLTDRSRRPLLIYALLELGIGIFAFVMPQIMAALDGLYVFIYQNVNISYFWLSVIRLALSFLVLLIPTTLMGGTLPVISRFVTTRFNQLGYRISLLYFINTLGAVVGTFATGFFLIALLGVNESAYLAGVLNLLIAFGVLILHKFQQQKPEAVQSVDFTPPGSPLSPANTGSYSNRLRRLVLWAIGISGFCSLAYEVLWARALIFILDNTAQAFTTMLSAFLLGIALGSLVVARWLDRSKNLLFWFAMAEILIGLFALLSIPVFGNLGFGLGDSTGNIYYPTSSQMGWAAIRFVRSFLVMLLPTVLMGMTFPLAIKIYSGNLSVLGKSVGKVYAINTIAGVIGSFGAGFILIPVIGVYRSVMLVAAINTIIGLVLLLSESIMRYKHRLITAFTSGVLFITALAVLLSYGKIMFISSIERASLMGVLYYNEDIGATVKVYQDAFWDKTLSIDGFPVAGTIIRHQDAQKSLGHFPMLLNQQVQPEVNIVGFGAGGSSWAATLYDTSYVDCVELVPAVLEAAEFLPEINHGVMTDTRLNLIQGDGRNYMTVTDKTYDIISVDATSPKSSGSGSLYALEFYQSCQQHLSENGLMVQWLPYHLMSEDDIKMTARTFQQVFPHATLWFSFQRHYYILIGTQQEINVDFQKLSHWMAQPSIQQELSPLGINDPYDFLSCFIMDERALANYSIGAKLNTDNHPYLEYEPTMSYLDIDSYVKENLSAIAPLRQNIFPYLVNTGYTEDEIQSVKTTIEQRIAATPVEHFWPQYLE